MDVNKSNRMHFINDSIHGLIQVSKNELNIIDTPLFQRLRHVKQILSYHAFPCANHTRFEHSIGVMHICSMYASHIYKDDPDVKHKVQLLRICGLCHDIAHGPFSHSWDHKVYSVLYPGTLKGHDIHRFAIVRGPLKEKIERCGINVEEVIDVWKGKDIVMKAMLNGPVGADRLDFLKRDSMYTNSKQFGSVAIERIIMASMLYDRDGHTYLHYKTKVLEEIVQVLYGRFSMYHKIYFHKV